MPDGRDELAHLGGELAARQLDLERGVTHPVEELGGARRVSDPWLGDPRGEAVQQGDVTTRPGRQDVVEHVVGRGDSGLVGGTDQARGRQHARRAQRHLRERVVEADAQLAGPLRRGDHRVDSPHVPTAGLVEEPAQRPPAGHQLGRHVVALEQPGHHDTTRRRVAARVAVTQPVAGHLARRPHDGAPQPACSDRPATRPALRRGRRAAPASQLGRACRRAHGGQHAPRQRVVGRGGGPPPDLGAGRRAAASRVPGSTRARPDRRRAR